MTRLLLRAWMAESYVGGVLFLPERNVVVFHASDHFSAHGEDEKPHEAVVAVLREVLELWRESDNPTIFGRKFSALIPRAKQACHESDECSGRC